MFLENYEEIAKRIKEIAKKQDLPLRELLEKCNLGINTISELSKGKNISFISFAKIAKCLNVSVDFLLGNVSAPTEEKYTIGEILLNGVSLCDADECNVRRNESGDIEILLKFSTKSLQKTFERQEEKQCHLHQI